MSDETKSQCERCGFTRVLKQYKPNLGKHPGKTVNVCGDCAGKDNKLIAVEKPVEVPAIEPAVPEAKVEEVPVKKFEAVPPEPISIPTPKSEPKPEPAEAKPACTEPISREEIRAKLVAAHKELDAMLESQQRILAQVEQYKLTEAERNKITRLEQAGNQLQQAKVVISVKKVEIASYRGILGEKG